MKKFNLKYTFKNEMFNFYNKLLHNIIVNYYLKANILINI